MEQISPIQALLQQRTLLQLEYYTEKEAFRKLTEQMGMQRKVKRGDAWFPLRVGKSFYNSLNQTAIEVFRTSDQDIEHNFEFGRPVMFFMVKKMGKNENQGSTALQLSENANHKVQSSNLKVQSNQKIQSKIFFLYGNRKLCGWRQNGDYRARLCPIARLAAICGAYRRTAILRRNQLQTDVRGLGPRDEGEEQPSGLSPRFILFSSKGRKILLRTDEVPLAQPYPGKSCERGALG